MADFGAIFEKPVRVYFFSGSPCMVTLVSCVIKHQHVCMINRLLYNVMLYVVAWVHGVTQLDDIVYVVCADPPVIKMFTADTLSPLGEGIHVEGMRSLTDIVACHRDRQLYVGDADCIWRVSVSDGHHTYVKWLTGIKVFMLSLTSHHLLVTSSQSPRLVTSREPLRLRQYDTTDGQLVREVQLPSYVNQVWHAAETSRDTFVLCHRGTSESVDQWAVSELFRLCRRPALT